MSTMEHLKVALLVTVGWLIVNSDFINCSCLTNGNTEYNDVTLDSVSDAIAQYTMKQYKEMVNNTQYDNILTSPFSIWSALTLTYLNARGQSSADLGILLGLNGKNKTQVADSLRELSVKVSSNGGNTFTVANKIAIEQTLQATNCIVNDTFASQEEANFRFNAEGERINLNNWVESKTNGLIKDLLPQGSINSATLLAIINAVYFKGQWVNEFNTQLTKEEFFYSLDKKSKVQMMHREGNMNFGSDDSIGASYVDLPYVDDKYSMLAILPYENSSSIDSVIEKMTPTTLRSIWNTTYSRSLQLSFPRFELTESYDLKGVISKMGAANIFESLNLSGCIGAPVAVRVSNVFHKVFLKVEEKGTEAAGATGVAVNFAAIFKQPTLIFNRPFAFILREKSTNAVLFMGVVRHLGDSV